MLAAIVVVVVVVAAAAELWCAPLCMSTGSPMDLAIKQNIHMVSARTAACNILKHLAKVC